MLSKFRFLITTMVFGCLSSSAQTVSLNNIPIDTSTIDLSVEAYNEISFRSRKLNLQQLENRTDSFALRIWNSSSISNPQLVFTLFYQNNTWNANKITYWPSFPGVSTWTQSEVHAKMFIDSSNSQTITPYKNFQEGVDSLLNLRIIHLPSDRKTQSAGQLTQLDGRYYTIEISKNGGYKLIYCIDPRSIAQDYPDLMEVKALLGLIARYFTSI